MKEKVLPVIVTTKEGLDICFQQNIRLLYIVLDLYLGNAKEIQKAMKENGYMQWDLIPSNGVFFGKNISPDEVLIEDPYNAY